MVLKFLKFKFLNYTRNPFENTHFNVHILVYLRMKEFNFQRFHFIYNRPRHLYGHFCIAGQSFVGLRPVGHSRLVVAIFNTTLSSNINLVLKRINASHLNFSPKIPLFLLFHSLTITQTCKKKHYSKVTTNRPHYIVIWERFSFILKVTFAVDVYEHPTDKHSLTILVFPQFCINHIKKSNL